MLRLGKRLLILLVLVLVIVGLSLLPSIFTRRGDAPRDPPPSGAVRTAAGAPPPADTRIEAWGDRFLEEVGTRPDGSFAFGAGAGGARELVVKSGGAEVRVPVAEGPVDIKLPGVGLAPPPEYIVVSGRLIEDGEDRPVAGAEVACGEARDISDERGRFSLGRIHTPGPEGPHLLVRSGVHRTLYLLPPGDPSWDDLFLVLVRR